MFTMFNFILTSGYWEILNSEKWLFGNLGASKGKRPHYVEILLPFFLKHCLWERRRTIKLQTGASWLLAVSFIVGASNIFFPAKFWKLQSACAHVIATWTGFHKILHVIFICCHLPRHILSSIIIFSCWAFLVSWLGLWDAPCFWLKVFAKGAGDEKSNEIPAQAVTALQTWTFAFSIQN